MASTITALCDVKPCTPVKYVPSYPTLRHAHSFNYEHSSLLSSRNAVAQKLFVLFCLVFMLTCVLMFCNFIRLSCYDVAKNICL
jgi:hypothetical protein